MHWPSIKDNNPLYFSQKKSDNVPKDLCEQRMNANLRLPPTEVWTDIFSFLPRGTLVQRVQPVNSWFKAICDKNVKCVRVIGDISDLLRKLGDNRLWAQRQLKALEGHDGALAEHFRMTHFRIFYNGQSEMAKMAVLRYSLDLFHSCQLFIRLQHDILYSVDERAGYYRAYLALLAPSKPSYIEISMEMDILLHRPPELPQSRFSQLLRHPTTLNCARLTIKLFRIMRDYYNSHVIFEGRMRVWDNRQAIFEWLHHCVDQVDKEEEEHGEEEVRCLNLYSEDRQNAQFLEWLFQQCVQNFEQSKMPEDRRSFVLTLFHSGDVLANFEYNNPATGEVLLLDRVVYDGWPIIYRLLRCLAHRVADNGKEQLFGKLFTPNRFFDEFNLERAGDDVAKQISHKNHPFFHLLPMSDDVSRDLCAKKMNANLRLPPAEVWTDIFSFLPRRTLVQRVQPVNLWFKEICDKNVKCVHIIGDFIWKLSQKKMLAQRQLEALAGHDCALAEHFRMTHFRIFYNGRNEMEKLSVLRHSLDLFRHCQLIIYPQARVLCSVDELAEYYQAYLTLLEPTKPSYILMQMDFGLTKLPVFPQSRFSQLLRHPTTLNCARLKLYGRMLVWDNRQAIFEWLHYQVDIGEHGEEVRCLNLYSVDLQNTQLQFFEWLLEQCVQNFEQSKVPEDRRYFVLTFRCFDNELENFEHKNQATGEVLFLERVLNEYGPPSRYQYYRLLRCLAHRVVNGTEQLFAKLFESDNFFKFNLKRAGDVAKVQIS